MTERTTGGISSSRSAESDEILPLIPRFEGALSTISLNKLSIFTRRNNRAPARHKFGSDALARRDRTIIDVDGQFIEVASQPAQRRSYYTDIDITCSLLRGVRLKHISQLDHSFSFTNVPMWTQCVVCSPDSFTLTHLPQIKVALTVARRGYNAPTAVIAPPLFSVRRIDEAQVEP